MVFCNTRIAVDRVNEFLTHKGYATKALHGANSQSNRMRSIQQFKKGDLEVLVATDVAARGIHVEELSMVINYDVPQDKDSYVHRIGRTGRAGNGGKAITLVTKDDLYTLYEIEEHVGVLIEEKPLPTDDQVSAMPKRIPVPKVRQPQKASTGLSESNKSKSHQTKPHKTKSHQSKPSQTKTSQNKPHQNKPHHSKPHQAGQMVSKKPFESGNGDLPKVDAVIKTAPESASKITPKITNEMSVPEVSTVSTKKPFIKRLVEKILNKK
jgi:superfamily II DNA/RNA helicase